MPRRVVLISDLQQGSRLEALGDFEWPSDVELDLKTVADDRLQRRPAAARRRWSRPSRPRPTRDAGVRVSNDAGSRASGSSCSGSMPTGRRVPASRRRLRPAGREPRRPRAPAAGSRAAPVAPAEGRRARRSTTRSTSPTRRKEEATVALRRQRRGRRPRRPALLPRARLPRHAAAERRSVLAPAARRSRSTSEPSRTLPLVIVAAETTPRTSAGCETTSEGGGTVLDVVTAAGPAETLAALAGVTPWDVEEAAVKRDVMLGEIAFDHPLFAPLAGAQFNDFTKIHFWKYRRRARRARRRAASSPGSRTATRRSSRRPLGKGRLVVLASGWNPADSQLARSSKFVPLMSALLEGRDPRPFDAANHAGRRPRAAAAPDGRRRRALVVHKPDGATVPIAPGHASFAETDQPGRLHDRHGRTAPRSFAVNLDPLESKTAPLHVETLEQFGCRLANHVAEGGRPRAAPADAERGAGRAARSSGAG